MNKADDIIFWAVTGSVGSLLLIGMAGLIGAVIGAG
jgi:hypothetical protein